MSFKLSDLLVYDDIVIQCHDAPDADTIASGYGVYCYLASCGKSPRLVYGGTRRITKPNLLMMVEQLQIPVEYVESIDSPQLLVTVDCVHGEKNVTDFPAQRYAVIDHHQPPEALPELSVINPRYGSCSTLVMRLLKKEGFPVDDDLKLSTALYYGLYMDTDRFSEIRHPADRDVRDFSKVDKRLISVLKNSNLSLPELEIAADAMKKVHLNAEKRFAVTVTRPCDPNILGFINDLILQVDSIDVSVVCGPLPHGSFKLSVRSCANDLHADELVKYVTDGIGSGGGQYEKAGGVIFEGTLAGRYTVLLAEYLSEKISRYYDSYDVIRAEEYTADLREMKKYRKLPETAGYVVSTDVVPAGTELRIRSISEEDCEAVASDDVYIMIRRRGNIYTVKRETLENAYLPSDEPIDGLFSLNCEYNPTIITESGSFEALPILKKYAKGCTAKNGFIYARKLERTLKLYTVWNPGNYMLGKVGDYLVARAGDPKDIYIIPAERFGDIYAEIN